MHREDRDRAEFDDCLCFAMCVEQEPQPVPTGQTASEDTVEQGITAAPLVESTDAQPTTDTIQIDSIATQPGTGTDAHTGTSASVDNPTMSTEATPHTPSPPATADS